MYHYIFVADGGGSGDRSIWRSFQIPLPNPQLRSSSDPDPNLQRHLIQPHFGGSIFFLFKEKDDDRLKRSRDRRMRIFSNYHWCLCIKLLVSIICVCYAEKEENDIHISIKEERKKRKGKTDNTFNFRPSPPSIALSAKLYSLTPFWDYK